MGGTGHGAKTQESSSASCGSKAPLPTQRDSHSQSRTHMELTQQPCSLTSSSGINHLKGWVEPDKDTRVRCCLRWKQRAVTDTARRSLLVTNLHGAGTTNIQDLTSKSGTHHLKGWAEQDMGQRHKSRVWRPLEEARRYRHSSTVALSHFHLYLGTCSITSNRSTTIVWGWLRRTGAKRKEETRVSPAYQLHSQNSC
jgi:hypothetical protein